ncbi:TPA: hypothetical protein NQS24_002239 [Klebsiella pneumoniae]|nr:hypothetical protein [Klebsiella pneumoniae]HBX0707453.1 hypothetical protein [Klebsiella pneumoniae]HCB0969493.1 hypothetical protein [Klebsiella pneumoniae]HCB1251195.1 hypothetical protein [Klebsiella pneumoniae]HCJ2336392.1 hypothetical protein [Klebsiella pneumoniae]
MTKDKAIAFLQVAGGFAVISGLMVMCYFSDRVPIIVAWMDNDMFITTAVGSAFLCILCLIYPAIFGLQTIINKIVGVPPESNDWEKEINAGVEQWVKDIKKGKK